MKTVRPTSRSLRRLVMVVLATMTSLLVVGCEEELIDDATFRLWCVDKLCSWKLDTGLVRPAPTWHKDDYGVELASTPTVISQDLKKSADCLVFTTVADIAPSAEVTVGFDFTGDGVIDHEQPLVASGFREVTTSITPPRTTTPPRIFISKKGVGRAVLAQLRLRSGNQCNTPPIHIRDRPLGDACTDGLVGECRSGVCCEGVCAECCLADSPYRGVDGNGTAIASAPAPCRNAASCERRTVNQLALIVTVIPLQCDPGRRLRAPNESCLGDDDCASGACDGASSALDVTQIFQDGGCSGADFPDAGGENCHFTRVSEGRCR